MSVNLRELYLTIGVVILCSMLVAACSASAKRVVVYVISCSSCPESFENDPTPYITDLEVALNRIGIATTDIEVRYLSAVQTDELDLLYQNFGVPASMRGMQLTVSVDGRFLFVNFVPVEFITEFLTEYSEGYQTIVIYRDLLRDLYVTMDKTGHIKECSMQNSIAECFGDQGLSSSTLGSVLSLVIIGGLLDSINPCAFSILLFFIAFVFAMSKVSIEKTRGRVMVVGSVYIAGVYLAYLAIGLGLVTVFSFLPFSGLIGEIGALLIILLGVMDVRRVRAGRGLLLGLSDSNRELITRWMDKLTIPSAFIAGALVSLFEFPCTGGIYFAILAMLSQRTTYLQGLAFLLVYNVAFVLPLVAICLFASRRFYSKEVLEFLSAKCPTSLKERIGLISGLAMIVLGIVLLFLNLA
jgi:cytochrome c biogenesis protein CcdA